MRAAAAPVEPAFDQVPSILPNPLYRKGLELRRPRAARCWRRRASSPRRGPVNTPDADLELVLRSVLNDLGKQYDHRNILDLAFQLLPLNFGLFKKKRAHIGIGAGNDFQVICSASIATAFQSVGFLIRPVVEQAVTNGDGSGETSDAPVFRMQHPSRIVPRDFDLSSNFDIIKFLRSPEGGSAVISKTPLVPISRVPVDRD